MKNLFKVGFVCLVVLIGWFTLDQTVKIYAESERIYDVVVFDECLEPAVRTGFLEYGNKFADWEHVKKDTTTWHVYNILDVMEYYWFD